MKGGRKEEEKINEKIRSPFLYMDTIKVIKKNKPFLLNSHICNLLKLTVTEGNEWFLNNKTHVHNIICDDVEMFTSEVHDPYARTTDA